MELSGYPSFWPIFYLCCTRRRRRRMVVLQSLFDKFACRCLLAYQLAASLIASHLNALRYSPAHCRTTLRIITESGRHMDLAVCSRSRRRG